MNLNLIKRYINKMDKKSLFNFLNNENIIVNNEELDYLYEVIKYDYDKILDEDTYLFKNIKNNINNDAYNKLISLLNKYKNLYLK